MTHIGGVILVSLFICWLHDVERRARAKMGRGR
jgi:hypothetical protein